MGDSTVFEMLQSYWYGWKMDLSVTAYLLILPYFLLSIQQFINKHWIQRFIYGYSMLLVLLISIIVATELELFVEWGIKLNNKAIGYLEQPAEVFSVTANSVLITIVVLLVLQVFIAQKVYKWLIINRPLRESNSIWRKIIFILIVPVLLIVMIRGGFQQIPINQSTAYYSKNNVLNNAAVNSAWNMTFSMLKGRKYKEGNPFSYYDNKFAQATVDGIYNFPNDSNTLVLKTSQPNVVMIILERLVIRFDSTSWWIR